MKCVSCDLKYVFQHPCVFSSDFLENNLTTDNYDDRDS